MNATHSLTTMLTRMPKAADRDALIEAHRQAAAFHEAMASALDSEREIEEGRRSGDPTEYWDKQYPVELGRAAVALQKMPFKWAAVLGEEVKAAPATPAAAAE